jgi:hypothetical protein
VVQCGADLSAKEHKFLSDALRAVAKRFEQIADKIDNPGGPLLDSAGRLIGASAGIGVAIPVDVVKGQLIRDGRVPVPGIGIIAESEDEAIRLSINGIIILRTLPQSAAAKPGRRRERWRRRSGRYHRRERPASAQRVRSHQHSGGRWHWNLMVGFLDPSELYPPLHSTSRLFRKPTPQRLGGGGGSGRRRTTRGAPDPLS